LRLNPASINELENYEKVVVMLNFFLFKGIVELTADSGINCWVSSSEQAEPTEASIM